ncbi:MAG TPA: glutamine--fructose-6-phosphate transaminase (isomerizing) [archaeon]|nr:glutamine--fructose-6-phosphate transaminase (isomerizing) [archaeon]
MCGIIGYVGSRPALPLILPALQKLEYRGYDSYGFASVDQGRLFVEKAVGKISAADVERAKLPGTRAAGHSRWATTGSVTRANAHPHLDCTGKLAVVHNGIVENFTDLKATLEHRGHRFSSETDTEVIPHLIEDGLRAGAGLAEAVRQAFSRLEGRNAILALHAELPGLVAARTGSPLIVGLADGETFVASDVPAFLEHTRDVAYLDDGEMVTIAAGQPPVFQSIATGAAVQKRRVTIDWDSAAAEKGSYAHFMLKEIMEQKDTIKRAIEQDDAEIEKLAQLIRDARGTFFIGCGTAGKVCFSAEYAFAEIADKHVNFVPASEFRGHERFLGKGSLVIAISQSGETADVLDALQLAKQKGATVVALVNVQGSSVARVADHVFLINAGPEKAVASTKATTAQLALVLLLAYATAGKLQEGKRLLLDAAGAVNDMLNPRYAEHIRGLAEHLRSNKNVYIIGRGPNYPMALESAIKIMEVSYIHAQGFAGGELKHGPLALIEKGAPCIVLAANDEHRRHIISNAMEVKARGGFIIGISPEKNPVFDYWIRVPDVGAASPIVNIIPIQLLAYYLGILRGNDIDMPRNLAKSVVTR